MTMDHPFRARLTGRAILASLLVTLASAGAHAAAPVWLRLETDEFTVYSDAPEKQAVECALRYAAFRRAFSELLVEPGRALPRSTLLLFYRDKPFRALVPVATGKNAKLVNYSCEIDGRSLNTFALAGDRDRALEMTFEFETIWALRRVGHFVPNWMSQGAGEVLSTVTVAKGKCLVGEPGEKSFADTMEWPRFFGFNESTKEYRDGGPELGEYLEQAWGLMHWILLADGDSRARFAALEQRLRTGTALDAVTATMNTPAGQFSKAIRRHFGAPREIPFDAAAVRATFRIAPAPEAEVLVQTADVLCAADRVPEGNLQLNRARELAPDSPAVREAWARRMLREGNLREAVQAYREAIDAGSKNYAAYLRSAVMRLNDTMSRGSDVAGDGGQEAVAALTEMRQAIALNPGSLECFRVLGRALYVLPDLKEEQVAELAPGVIGGAEGGMVRLYRALLYGRLGKREECARDFRAILADPETSDQLRGSALQQFAREMLALDAGRTEKLVAAHDYAAAFEIVAAGESEPEAAVAAAGYARLRTWLNKAVRRDRNATAAERKLAGLE